MPDGGVCPRAGEGPLLRRVLVQTCALVGFAPYWFFLRRPGLFYSLAGHSDTTAAAVGWYLAYLAFVVVAVLAAVALAPLVRQGCERGAGRRLAAALLGAFAVQALLKVLETAVGLPGVSGTAVALLDTSLYAVVLVALTCLWAAWCVGVGPRRAALTAVGSFTLSFFVKFVGFAPEPVATVASALLPLASGACWCMASRGCGPALASHADGGAGIAGIQGPARWITAMLVAFLVAGGVFRGVAFGMVDGAPIDPRFSVEDAISVAVALLVLAYYLVHSSMLRLPWFVMPLSMVVFFAGLLLMMVLADDRPAIGGGIVIVGRTILGLLLWMTLVDAVRGNRLPVTRVFGVLFVLVDVVSSLFGYVLVPFAVSLLGFSLGNTAAVLSSAVALILMATSVMLFGRALNATLDPGAGNGNLLDAARPAVSHGPAKSDRLTQPPRSQWPASEHPALERPVPEYPDLSRFAPYGLTAREAEVARLLAEGNSQKKIAELLGVSMGTVQTHVKGVYRKLGIHSRQELIDLTHGV